MDNYNKLLILIIVWLICCCFLIINDWRKKSSVGISLSFVLTLSIVHFFGALIYLNPTFSSYYYLDFTYSGFQLAVISLISFLIGNVLIGPFIYKLTFSSNKIDNSSISYKSYSPMTYFIIGLMFYLFLSPIIRIQTLGAIVYSGSKLIIAGTCLGAYYAYKNNHYPKFYFWLLISLLFPLLTIINSGYIGYGISMFLPVIIFAAIFYKSKFKLILLLLLLLFINFSVYVTYMRDRNELRDIIWSNSATIPKITVLANTLYNFELFNPNEDEHLKRIDKRMNLNFLVGHAYKNLSNSKQFAYGETYYQALTSVVPRAIWKNKPFTGGSNDLVTTYTGIKFAEGTSVGVGNVMEAFINFGYKGIIFTFIFIGIILYFFDTLSFFSLSKGNIANFIIYFTVGLSFYRLKGPLEK